MLSVSKWTLCFVSVFVHWFIVTNPTNAHDAAELATDNSNDPDKLNLSRRWTSSGIDAREHERKPETTVGRRGILLDGTSKSDILQEAPQQHLAVRTPGSGANNFRLPAGFLRDPSNLLSRGDPNVQRTVNFAPGNEETQRFMTENPEMAQKIMERIRNSGAGDGEEIIKDENGNPVGRVRYSTQTQTVPGKPQVFRFEESSGTPFRMQGQPTMESFRQTGQPTRTETFRQEGSPFRREESFRTEGKPLISESSFRGGGESNRDRDRDRSDSDSDSDFESGSDDDEGEDEDEDKDGGFSSESTSSSSKSPPSGGKSSKTSKAKKWTPAPKDRLLAVVHKRVVKYNQGSKSASNAQWKAAKAAKRKRAAKNRSYSRSGSASWSASRSGGSRSASRKGGARSSSRGSGSRKSGSRSSSPSRSPSKRSPSPGGKRSKNK